MSGQDVTADYCCCCCEVTKYCRNCFEIASKMSAGIEYGSVTAYTSVSDCREKRSLETSKIPYFPYVAPRIAICNTMYSKTVVTQ